MNIFFLDQDPVISARYHCDKHVVKMILEYCSLLSSVHRFLDGTPCKKLSKSGKRTIWTYNLPDYREEKLYSSTHGNSPCTKWVLESSENYNWLFKMFQELCHEYTYRYEKTHKVEKQKLNELLIHPPKNISNKSITQGPKCMPDEYKVENDTITSYRLFYIHDKVRFAKWTKREPPEWFYS